jgi:hypothetical protein
VCQNAKVSDAASTPKAWTEIPAPVWTFVLNSPAQTGREWTMTPALALPSVTPPAATSKPKSSTTEHAPVWIDVLPQLMTATLSLKHLITPSANVLPQPDNALKLSVLGV